MLFYISFILAPSFKNFRSSLLKKVRKIQPTSIGNQKHSYLRIAFSTTPFSYKTGALRSIIRKKFTSRWHAINRSIEMHFRIWSCVERSVGTV